MNPNARSLVATFLLLAFMSPPTANAYVPSITNKSKSRLKWMKSNCVVLKPHKDGTADVKDGSDLKAIERAVNNWHKEIESCSFLRIKLLKPTADAKIEFDDEGLNQSVIKWIESGWPHERQAAGITTVFFVDKEGSSQDGRILDADIEINGQYFKYSTTGAKDRTDVENTVTHELGHLMGLDHPCDDGTRNPVPPDHEGDKIPKCFPVLKLPAALKDTTMYNFADQGETKKRSPEKDDVQGICDTYPDKEQPKECVETIDLTPVGCSVASRPSRTPVVVLLLLACLALFVWTRRRYL